MKAVVIGPGRIGCGFVGQLLRASGHEVVFVARDPAMVDYLNRVGRYAVRLCLRGQTQEILVADVRAVPAFEPRRVAEEIAGAGLIATAVGAGNLRAVAPLIAAGLRKSRGPVNVLAFENSGSAGPCLCDWVAGHLPQGFPLAQHGFSGALVSRIVAERCGCPAKDDILCFMGDPFIEFIVDGRALRRPLPAIQGMKVTDQYEAWAQRKLYTFNAGHATAAYLSYLKGYRYIHSAIRDPEIRAAVLAAMREGQRGLAARYGAEIAGDENTLLEIVPRFENAMVCDAVERVGRDPQRKLGAEERLVGAARLAEAAGINPETLGLAMAAALYFFNPNDFSAAKLQRKIQALGPKRTLSQLSGLAPDRALARLVVRHWRQLSNGWQPGNLLLSLTTMLWTTEREVADRPGNTFPAASAPGQRQKLARMNSRLPRPDPTRSFSPHRETWRKNPGSPYVDAPGGCARTGPLTLRRKSL
ncbi:MAG: hypothetical protein ACE5IP_02080 [Terriglobia bacterium]